MSKAPISGHTTSPTQLKTSDTIGIKMISGSVVSTTFTTWVSCVKLPQASVKVKVQMNDFSAEHTVDSTICIVLIKVGVSQSSANSIPKDPSFKYTSRSQTSHSIWTVGVTKENVGSVTSFTSMT